jgi:formylglycine-generating enzyme required for sulfatase activity
MPVGQKNPNELGIYDMTGNVEEWCSDWYKEFDKDGFECINPIGALNGTKKVTRGGSYQMYVKYSTVLFRWKNIPDNRMKYVGFRFALKNEN